jgi:hypothetical protein
LPVIYNQPRNLSPHHSPQNFNNSSNNSRVMVSQPVNIHPQNYHPNFVTIPVNNQQHSQVLVHTGQSIPKIPISGQVNFNSPVSPRVTHIPIQTPTITHHESEQMISRK